MTIKRASMIGWCFTALLCCACAYGQVNMQYFYDSAGRLTLAVDSTGVAIQYVYDPVGNITAINRPSVGSYAILNFIPSQGAPGSLVTIQGLGFSSTPGNNVVREKPRDSLECWGLSVAINHEIRHRL